ncbi:meiotic recombination protein rec12 [Echria macrotheca]|uniref:DNA topoisomerase (ATP-hydrolyzing) n=1 Tax=Echria macrotheca TaxID=438768 RepID=A0AAJ0BFP3_9PEZI|nr:meiotic recombination protein rec12 [Echria macrotheca]
MSLRSRFPSPGALEQNTPLYRNSAAPRQSSITVISSNQLQAEAVARIEAILESVLDAIHNRTDLVIPYRSIRSSSVSEKPEDGFVRFPGRTAQEAKRFEALFRIIELSHEALISGHLITKRNIYYQNVDLFKSQSVVDEMVDTLAYTLGLGRGDLNIVAAAKGLISGPIDLIMRGGETIRCTQPADGLLLPMIQTIEKVDLYEAEWLLVIEKEATFRTLAAGRYHSMSAAGTGILITAKGFPDLATRRFLYALQSARPELRMYALVDFDPHGIAILRTYRYGSKRLDHEIESKVPSLRWLGIRSGDVLARDRPESGQDGQLPDSQSSQESVSFSQEESEGPRPYKRVRTQEARDPDDSVLYLTENDRKKAIDLMTDICQYELDNYALEQLQELQRMLMLGIKAEIQAVDDFGNLAKWLDKRLKPA